MCFPKLDPNPSCESRGIVCSILAGITALVQLLLVALPSPVQAQFAYLTNNSTITISGYSGPGGDIAIPSTVHGMPVTLIGTGAFDGRTNLTSISLPDSITMIAFRAFHSCSRLGSVSMINVTNIGGWAFTFCAGLTNISLGNRVATIGDGAFQSCSNLTTIRMPAGLTNIGGWAFYRCARLEGVYFEGNAPTVGEDAFGGTSGLTLYHLPGTGGWGDVFAGQPTAFWHLANPHIIAWGVQTNTFGFLISCATNASVVVEACTNLLNPVWVPLTTNTGTGPTFYFPDSNWKGYSSRFYRLRSL